MGSWTTSSFHPVLAQLFIWIHMPDLLFIPIKLHSKFDSLLPPTTCVQRALRIWEKVRDHLVQFWLKMKSRWPRWVTQSSWGFITSPFLSWSLISCNNLCSQQYFLSLWVVERLILFKSLTLACMTTVQHYCERCFLFSFKEEILKWHSFPVWDLVYPWLFGKQS